MTVQIWKYDDLREGDGFVDAISSTTFVILDIGWDPYLNEDEYTVSWLETRRDGDVRKMKGPRRHGQEFFIEGTKL